MLLELATLHETVRCKSSRSRSSPASTGSGESISERVEDVRTGLVAIATLAQDAWDGRDRGDDPTVVTVLIEDRQIQRLHGGNDSAAASRRAGTAACRTTPDNSSLCNCRRAHRP
jgi:hypothetical protein